MGVYPLLDKSPLKVLKKILDRGNPIGYNINTIKKGETKMTIVTKKEYREMMETIIDEETGMTALDWWEITHPYDELIIVGDED